MAHEPLLQIYHCIIEILFTLNRITELCTDRCTQFWALHDCKVPYINIVTLEGEEISQKWMEEIWAKAKKSYQGLFTIE